MIIKKVQDSYDELLVKLSYNNNYTIGKLIKDKISHSWYVVHNSIELAGHHPINISQYGDYKYGWNLFVVNYYILSEYKVELFTEETKELTNYEIY